MNREPGMRVGAILSMNRNEVRLLGYGVYEGHEVPPDEGGGSMTGLVHEAGVGNPKIRLDNGDVVWGCECWWAPESEIKARVGKLTAAGASVVDVRIADARRDVGAVVVLDGDEKEVTQ